MGGKREGGKEKGEKRNKELEGKKEGANTRHGGTHL